MKRAIGITRVSAEGDRETVHSYATGKPHMPQVIVCTHDSGEYSFANENDYVGGWAQRGPVEIPQEIIDQYMDALKAKRKAARAIDEILRVADLD